MRRNWFRKLGLLKTYLASRHRHVENVIADKVDPVHSVVNLKCATFYYTLPIKSVPCFADSENEKKKIKATRLLRRTKKVIDSESTFNFQKTEKKNRLIK